MDITEEKEIHREGLTMCVRACACVHVFVCVCVREMEREKEREMSLLLNDEFLSILWVSRQFDDNVNAAAALVFIRFGITAGNVAHCWRRG